MAERNLIVYEASPLASFAAAIAEAGYGVCHSRSSIAHRVREGGDVELVTVDDLYADAGAPGLSFQLWQNDSPVLHCQIRRAGHAVVLHLALEGTTPAERARIRDVMLARFQANPDGIGLVYDPEGTTEDVDWDRFFALNERLDAQLFGLPELLVMESRLLGQLENLPAFAKVDRNGRLVFLHR